MLMKHQTKFLILLFVVSLIIGACENDIQEVNEILSSSSAQMEVIEDVELLYSDSANLRVKILAPTLHRVLERNQQKEVFPDGVYVEFYENNEVSSWLYADKAQRFEKEDKIIARENVLLYNVDRDTFRSDELVWDEKAERVYSDKVFKFSSPDEVIYGYKFNSNQQFTDFTFHKMSGLLQVEMLEKQYKNRK